MPLFGVDLRYREASPFEQLRIRWLDGRGTQDTREHQANRGSAERPANELKGGHERYRSAELWSIRVQQRARWRKWSDRRSRACGQRQSSRGRSDEGMG